MLNSIKENYSELLQAANDFYNGRDTKLSDEEYDIQLEKFESETGESILDYVELPKSGKSFPHQVQLNGLPKKKLRCPESEYLKEFINWESENIFVTWSPKLDGCSVVIYYKNGKYNQALSASGKKTGIDNTKKFKDLVPNEVDPKIRYIRCEAMVDLNSYEGSNVRNKANGLVNSKHKDQEVRDNLVLRYFEIRDVDGNIVEDHTLMSKLEGRITFVTAGAYNKENLMLMTEFLDNGDTIIEDRYGKWLIDGAVATDFVSGEFQGFKYYRKVAKEGIVKSISWHRAHTGGFTPKVKLESAVEISGKRIKQVSSGGIKTMRKNKFGVGSTVMVALQGSTIPKIVDTVIESEDYGIEELTCKCGCNDFVEIANQLRCSNKECDQFDGFHKRVLFSRTEKKGLTVGEVISSPTLFADLAASLINIPRWNKKSIRKSFTSEGLLDSMENETKFQNYLLENLRLTNIQKRVMDLNVLTAYRFIFSSI